MSNHKLTITQNAAGCSCRVWICEQRRESETPGQFTNRAYVAHLAHVNAPAPNGWCMFDTAPEGPTAAHDAQERMF